jgi:hypothetical protein
MHLGLKIKMKITKQQQVTTIKMITTLTATKKHHSEASLVQGLPQMH